MIFSRKERKTADHSPNNETGLSPVLHVIESLNEYRTDLINKEVASLFELSRVGSSFDGVIEKADKFQTQLQEFGESFPISIRRPTSTARCVPPLPRPLRKPRIKWKP